MSLPVARADRGRPSPATGALVAAVAVALAYLSAAGGLLWWSTAPAVTGWRPTVVLTGSMSPALRPGDVALIAPATVSPDDLPAGRVVLVSDPARDTGTYLHRVEEWEGDDALITRGDANRTVDQPTVTADRVLGQVRLVVPAIGSPAVWLHEGDWPRLAVVVVVTWLALVGAARARGLLVPAPARRHGRRRARRRAGRPPRALLLPGTAVLVAACTLAASGLVTGTVAPWSSTTTAALNSFATGVFGQANLQWWGSGAAGQGAAPDVSGQWSLTPVPGGTAWRAGPGAVASGTDYSCAIRTDGTLWCWGSNTEGQLGDGTTTTRSTPAPVAGGGTWTSVAAGTAHTCAVRSDASVWCWGRNQNAQLGSLASSTSPVTSPTQVRTGPTTVLTGASLVTAGDGHSCVLTTGTALYCWGRNTSGQTGGGGATPFDLGSGWAAVSAGLNHTCAVKGPSEGPGALYCWGDNTWGQALSGGDSPSVPRRVGASGWAGVTAGAGHTCGVRLDGTMACWGRNAAGQLGTGDTTGTAVNATVPREAGSATTWTAAAPASGSGDATCGLRGTSLWCWGANAHGELGLGQAGDRPEAAAAPGSWAAAALGARHLCAIDTGGTLACAGANGSGQLARTATATGSLHPADVGSATWATISVGEASTCGTQEDGSLWCWGSNSSGQLGTGDTNPRSAPTRVGASTAWTAVAVGGVHTCGLQQDASLWCWGRNTEGQLGVGAASPSPLTNPARVPGWTFTSVTTGGHHTCGTTSTGTAVCWGDNAEGQLGLGDRLDRAGPTAVGGLTTWRSLDAGRAHTCGVPATGSGGFGAGTLWCWGDNSFEQLGDFSSTDRLAPAQIGSVTTWTTATLGDRHSCGTRADATLYCWGAGSDGQLGTGGTTAQNRPVQVLLGTARVSAVALGSQHTCALMTDRTVRCWGDGGEGQLGLGSTAGSPTPVTVPGAVDTVAVAAGGRTTFRVVDAAAPAP